MKPTRTRYRNICQPDIMTKTPETLPYAQMPNIMTDTGTKCPKTDLYMTYLKKKNIYEAIDQNLRKEYVYETNTHKI